MEGESFPMRRGGRFAWLVTTLVVALWPGLLAAQSAADGTAKPRGIGVVTTLSGTVTVARAALPAPQPLKFKDDVFERDRISTAERSIVRVLLGGKALITVRELSSLTITEEASRSTVDLASGKVAVGVAHQRMRPGEIIEIRTPNAIAAVRGTVLVVELIPVPGTNRFTTRVTVVHGVVEVYDPADPGAPPVKVSTLESFERTGTGPFSLTPISKGAVPLLLSDLRSAPQFSDGPGEFMRLVGLRETARAAILAELLAPELAEPGTGEGGGLQQASMEAQDRSTPGNTAAPLIPPLPLASDPTPGEPDPPGSPGVPGSAAGETTLTGPPPYILNNQRARADGDLHALSSGSVETLPRLLDATDSSIRVAGDVVALTGQSSLTSGANSPLVNLDRSTLEAAGSALSISGNSIATLLSASAPLLRLTRGAAVSTGADAIKLAGNSALVSQGPLVSLDASSMTVRTGAALSLGGGSTVLVNGDLFALRNGSALTVANGTLLSLGGGSSLTVTGALLSFVGSGNAVSVNNSLCAAAGACRQIGGLWVSLSNGASPSNVSIQNPVRNPAGGSLNLGNGAAISVSGANSRVTILGL